MTMKIYELFIILLLLSGAALGQEPRRATVERVIDGDTIVLVGGEKVRLLGIDADEFITGTPRAFAAALFLAQDITGKEIFLISDKTQPYAGFYARTLAYVHLVNRDRPGIDVGKQLVQFGLVDVSSKYPCDRTKEYLRVIPPEK